MVTHTLYAFAIYFFQAMSIYGTVSAHNLQNNMQNQNQSDISDIQYEDPLVRINSLTEKGTTMAGQPVPNEDDSLAEYFSDDEERAKALARKEKKDQQLHKLEKET